MRFSGSFCSRYSPCFIKQLSTMSLSTWFVFSCCWSKQQKNFDRRQTFSHTFLRPNFEKKKQLENGNFRLMLFAWCYSTCCLLSRKYLHSQFHFTEQRINERNYSWRTINKLSSLKCMKIITTIKKWKFFSLRRRKPTKKMK